MKHKASGHWTPVPNRMLEEFAKGVLKFDEMRIALHVIRQTRGFGNKKTGKRQVWTRRLTHREIAKETRIAPNIVSSTIKQMEMKKILHQNNKRYQINENYEEWIMEDRRTVKNLDSQESLLKESKNLPERVKNFDAEHPSTSSQTSDCETLKETIKETSKENTHVRIVNRWNELVDRDGKLPEYRREPDTLKSIVNERLKCYCEDEIV